MLLTMILSSDKSFFTILFNRMHEGGLFFMIPILVMLLLVFFLIIKNVLIIKKQNHLPAKYIQIINSIGLMTLVWGILGQLIGLVGALDKIEFLGEISTARLAGGLKVSALTTMFGCLVFVISRIATIIFTWTQKEDI